MNNFYDLYKEGNEHFKNKNFPKAVDCWKAAILDQDVTDKVVAMCHYNIGTVLLKEGNYSNAIEYIVKAINYYDTPKAMYYHNLGVSYTKLKNYKMALICYKRALSIEDDKDTWYNLQIVEAKLKRG